MLNADDPLVADLGRHAPDAHLLRRRRRLARAPRAPARQRLQALPPLRPRLHLRGGLPRPPRPLPLPELRPGAPASRPSSATDVELRGIRSAAFTLRGRRVELPLPGLYNVYNALGAAALTLSLGVELDDVVAGLQAVAPAFGRAETLDLGGRPASLLLVKNPAGANEVLRTLALEGGELDLFGVLNDRIADGRDVSWVWDADWELLVGQRAPLHRARARAPPSSRCG